MREPGRFFCVTAAALLGGTAPAQSQVVIRGRVEDASARTPIAGARVVAPDTTAVFTDSLGAFSIRIDEGAPLFVEVTQYGYTFQRFDLPAEAPSLMSVLLLEPNAIELEGINVVAESSVARLLNSLRSRRNASPVPVQAFDRARLDDLAGAGSVWDFVSSRARVQECNSFSRTSFGSGNQTLQDWWRMRSGVCSRGGAGVLVCVNGWDSFAAISELSSMDIRSVALVEIYGRGGAAIRVYTSQYLLSMASQARTLYFWPTSGC